MTSSDRFREFHKVLYVFWWFRQNWLYVLGHPHSAIVIYYKVAFTASYLWPTERKQEREKKKSHE